MQKSLSSPIKTGPTPNGVKVSDIDPRKRLALLKLLKTQQKVQP